MTVAEIMAKMISFSEGNIHDIDHLIRVWTYAKTISSLEELEAETQYVLEVAAITHDIACPMCREMYGNTNGKLQEKEGESMVRAFLKDSGMSKEEIDRVSYLVGHHHTFSNIDGMDYQILIEADYIANAAESGYTKSSIENALSKIIKTKSATRLILSMFCL
ncbi:HD domain-containing protein [Enterocloster asparagiformis]|uniref:HD domain-containing protein n=1 Tax=Enterocloster asparagiformis TaxID=333367 RepID=UPI000464EF73|nr:HD domain-containing protein [Enterocloster asparagiformis]